jgi:lipopolysaccharide export system permease protein
VVLSRRVLSKRWPAVSLAWAWPGQLRLPIHEGRFARGWRRISAMIGWTLGRYLCARLALTISAVFLMISGMIYVVDFVELLRRAGSRQGVSAGFIAYLSLLHVPSISEQIMPFCVLFGTMAAFLILSRKLELLVARSVGVSVWGLLLPPVAIATLTGVVSVVVLNPLHVSLKHRADAMEAQLFGRDGKQSNDEMVWIRQRSVDGEAFIKASRVSLDGTKLTAPTAYVYGRAGKFEQRIEAQAATLLPGVWQLDQARVTAPGEEGLDARTYLLATNLSGEEVLQGAIDPASVPFWSLPWMRAAADVAGLDGDRYRLQFHMLLARPLLYVAMVLIAAAFSLRFFRFGGIEKMVFSGAAAGFMLYGALKLVGDLGGAGVLSPAVAAWSPAAVASLLGVLALLNQEDG